MPRQFVEHLRTGQSVDEVFLLSEKQLRANRNGDLFLLVHLRDRTGRAREVWEIEADPRVTVTFQGDDRFAVLEGNAVIVADKRQIADLWSEDWRRWFPRGKDDPTLCLLRVAPQSGEYWDRSGLNGLTFLFDGLKAILQGTRAETDEPARHAKVQQPGKH